VFSPEELQEISELQKRYGAPQASLLPVLWKIQEKNGWIDDKAMDEAARICDVPKSHVLGVVSFYTMFFDKPMGRFHVQVCTNVSCMLRGGEKLSNAVKAAVGAEHMQRSADGTFSFEEVECMGACGGAPMIAVNETFFEQVSLEEAAQIIALIKSSGNVPQPKRTVQLPELSFPANE
jgi:NADH-quinone oxidoreductase subunit E/NADH dehydrogenase (ubiquinone) flavoprotein 2